MCLALNDTLRHHGKKMMIIREEIKIMSKIEVNDELCKGCLFCTKVCPKQIIKVSDSSNSRGYKYVEQFDVEKCIGCKFCAIMCPDSAIEVYK